MKENTGQVLVQAPPAVANFLRQRKAPPAQRDRAAPGSPADRRCRRQARDPASAYRAHPFSRYRRGRQAELPAPDAGRGHASAAVGAAGRRTRAAGGQPGRTGQPRTGQDRSCATEPEVEKPAPASGGFFAWLGRLFGGGRPRRRPLPPRIRAPAQGRREQRESRDCAQWLHSARSDRLADRAATATRKEGGRGESRDGRKSQQQKSQRNRDRRNDRRVTVASRSPAAATQSGRRKAAGQSRAEHGCPAEAAVDEKKLQSAGGIGVVADADSVDGRESPARAASDVVGAAVVAAVARARRIGEARAEPQPALQRRGCPRGIR